MSNWKSASEMFSYTKQNVEARESLVNHQMPYYMDKAMECIMNRAGDCEYTCDIELHPEKGEDIKFFGLVISAICKELKTLGYSVTKSHIQFGIKVSWASEETKYPRV